MAVIKLRSIVLCVFVWATMTYDVLSSTQTCLLPPPCSCDGDIELCFGVDFTSFPTFRVSNVTRSLVIISIHGNNFTTVPANAFRNLTVSSNTRIDLLLYQNNLNSIEKDAFAGIANIITYLGLKSNNFVTIPPEVESLSQLQILSLEENPISSLNRSTMHVLGYQLQSLIIDLDYFSSWPTELSLLTSLEELYVRYLTVTHLSNDVFDGFANTLHTLYIGNTQLERIPVAVCHLHKLQSLDFSNNKNANMNDTVFEEPCSRELTSVTSVYLYGNHLRRMPDVFRTFPSMTHLAISYNELSYIHWDIIPTGHPLRSLYMFNNDFTRIPTAINKLTALKQLYMWNNTITSIEDCDLNSLTQLEYLNLGNNPIEYISPNAFKNNRVLRYWQRQNTTLPPPSNSSSSPSVFISSFITLYVALVWGMRSVVTLYDMLAPDYGA